jgi:2-oxoglutarate ferredoxin oxidoreductase subunit beta
VNNAANVRKTKTYIKKAFEAQLRGEGFTLVEILSPCPTNWGMQPPESVEWLEGNMIPFYRLGEIKNTLEAQSSPKAAAASTAEAAPTAEGIGVQP